MAHELEHDLQHVLQHTESIWQLLAGSNILITGGTGFVGSWLLESFLWANERLRLDGRVFVLTRDPQAFRAKRPHLAENPALEILSGDLKTFRFPPQQLHYLIHAAVEHESPSQDAAATLAANLQGTRRVLQIARAHGTQRLLYTSSGAVYGEQPVDIDKLSEDFAGAPQPDNVYAQAKRESEALLAASSHPGLNVVIARLFAFVGPYLPLNKNFAIGNFVRDARLGGPILIEGDGTPLRSYLYAADLAIWLWKLLLNGESAQPYNVGSDQALSVLELARTVERVCCLTSGVSIAKSPIPGAKPKRYVPSTDRARTGLGLASWVTLDEGIHRMFAWYQRNDAYASIK